LFSVLFLHQKFSWKTRIESLWNYCLRNL